MFSTSIPLDNSIKLSFFDNDGKKVNGLSIQDAINIYKVDNTKKFYLKDGNGQEKELSIEQVKEILPTKNLLPSNSECSTGPVVCGPPLVRFFGGGGFGAAANAVISPISSSVIGFDIVNPGKGYKSAPSVELVDPCGKGSGCFVKVNIVNGSVANMSVLSPGDGYLTEPDGSLGGNERVWKEPDEGYVITQDGGYYVVQPYRPIEVQPGSVYYPPSGSPRLITETETITLSLTPVTKPTTSQQILPGVYPTILCIEEIQVVDPGFGYRPGDELIITPDRGTTTELVVNEFGEIDSVKILNGGCGFDDFPEIRTNSPTGFNATFTPIFSVNLADPNILDAPIPDDVILVNVVDCVGRVPLKKEFDIVPR